VAAFYQIPLRGHSLIFRFHVPRRLERLRFSTGSCPDWPTLRPLPIWRRSTRNVSRPDLPPNDHTSRSCNISEAAWRSFLSVHSTAFPTSAISTASFRLGHRWTLPFAPRSRRDLQGRSLLGSFTLPNSAFRISGTGGFLIIFS